jgi:hypothetical protein
VNFRQPSHEFTFNVGIDLISKLKILTLIIYQVRSRMWYVETIVYARIKHLSEELTSRTHMQLGESSRRHEKLAREERGRTGPKRPWADRPGPTSLARFQPCLGFPLT